jgi:hypothetical protein
MQPVCELGGHGKEREAKKLQTQQILHLIRYTKNQGCWSGLI